MNVFKQLITFSNQTMARGEALQRQGDTLAEQLHQTRTRGAHRRAV